MKKDTEQQYSIRWEIDIWATSPEQAAFRAMTIMRDKDSLATYFDVKPANKRDIPKQRRRPTINVNLEHCAVCNSCGRVFKPELFNVLAAIPKLLERIEPGKLVPSCECPECKCLAYPALKMIE